MKKSVFTFGLLISLFMILTAPFANLNILSNPAMAQGYKENYSEDKKYSKYPTEENKYECKTGPFQGFFVSSVEFCKFKFDDKRDNRTGTQGPPGPAGPAGPLGAPGANGTNGINGTNGVNGTDFDPCVACLLDALAKLDSGAILVNVTAEIGLPRGDVNITLPMVLDVDVALLLQQQLAFNLGLNGNATIFEICAAINEQGLDIEAVIDGLEVTLVSIVEDQISKLALTIVAAINDLLGTSIVLTPEEVIAAVDIDDIVAQITANVQVSLEILEACLTPPPPEESALLQVTKVIVCFTNGSEPEFFEVCNSIFAEISPNLFDISVTGNNPNPSNFDGPSSPLDVKLGPGNYQISETTDSSVNTTISDLETSFGADISGPVSIFNGDCTKGGDDFATGTIAEGEVQSCLINNAFTVESIS